MSIDATRSTWKINGISATKKIILLSCADRAADGDLCWPSLRRLAIDTGLDRGTLIKNRQQLIDEGYIEFTGEFKGRSGQIPVMRLTYVVNREDEDLPLPLKPKKEEYFSDPTCGEMPTGKTLTSREMHTGTGVEMHTGTSREIHTVNLKEEANNKKERETFSDSNNFDALRTEICADSKLQQTFKEKNLTNKYPTLADFFDFYKEYQLTNKGPVTRYGFMNWLHRERAIPLSSQSPTQTLDKSRNGGPIYARQTTVDQEYRLFRSAFENDKIFGINGRNENSIAPSYDEWLNSRTGSA